MKRSIARRCRWCLDRLVNIEDEAEHDHQQDPGEKRSRYAELTIDVAERGLIAISGHNESGKSSIGETVCFALFVAPSPSPQTRSARSCAGAKPPCGHPGIFGRGEPLPSRRASP